MISQEGANSLNVGTGGVQMTTPNSITISDPLNTMKYYQSTLPINLTVAVSNALQLSDYFIVTLSSFYQNVSTISCVTP